MNVIRFTTADRYEAEKDWQRISLCREEPVSVEYFVKPPHHASPRHEHPNAQVLVVLEGCLEVATDADGSVRLQKGDAAFIPPGEAHVVRNVQGKRSVGLDIFVPGRAFDFWLTRVRP